MIFDVAAAGAGVEVYQPVEVQSGGAIVAPVVDGDQQLSFKMTTLRTENEVVISANLDNVLENSSLGQIRVAGRELDGATVRMTIAGEAQTAIFTGGRNSVVLNNAYVI